MSQSCPEEVLTHNERYWSSWAKILGLPETPEDESFDIERLVWYPKSSVSRCQAWINALKTKKAVYTDGQNGWRKCHTENYWCYYAKIPNETRSRSDKT